MKSMNDIIGSVVRNYKMRKECELRIRANMKYQISERDGELWLLFDNVYVCPCSMLKDAPVEAIEKMRTLYLKAHK